MKDKLLKAFLNNIKDIAVTFNMDLCLFTENYRIELVKRQKSIIERVMTKKGYFQKPIYNDRYKLLEEWESKD